MGSRSSANLARGAGLPEDRIRIIRDGDRLHLGRFTVAIFGTPHSPRMHFPGTIDAPLRSPARASSYREGGNFSFLIEHGTTRILVVPSANYVAGRLRDVRADVVFLSIGMLGKQSCAFATEYWNETVRSSRARLVIPIHWDDFTRPLSRPLVPMRRGVDDFDRAMRIILSLAQRDGVTVRLPQPFIPIDMTQRAAGGSRAISTGCP
jgi:L-ascorbate metabolism protein UlaG (beta-lactamase superfamily)